MARILFGDDDRDLRHVFRTLLEQAGHELLMAAAPADVLAHLKDGHPDLVMVDLRFPKSHDGLALIRNIRESGSKTPILLLSGAPDEIEGQPEEAMITRLLPKPPRVLELLQAIEELTHG